MSGFLRSWKNRRNYIDNTLRHPQGASSMTAALCLRHIEHSAIFVSPALCGFIIHDDYVIGHDYLDHNYIMIGYLNIDIQSYVYSYSSVATPINSLHVIMHPWHSAVIAGGNRRETRKAPEGDTVTAPGTDLSETQLMMAQRRRRAEEQDFKFQSQSPASVPL